MAGAVMVGAVLGDAVSKLSDTIIHVIEKTSQFRSNLTQIQETLTRIKPIFKEIDRLNQVLDLSRNATDMLIDQLKGAKELAMKCENIRWNFFKRYSHSEQIDVPLQEEARDVMEVTVVKDAEKRMEKGRSGGGWKSWFYNRFNQLSVD